MTRLTRSWTTALITCCLLHFNLSALQLLVSNAEGESVVIEIAAHEDVATLCECIEQTLGWPNDGAPQYVMEVLDEFAPEPDKGVTSGIALSRNHARKAAIATPRNYKVEVAAAEKKDIRYITTTLANKPLSTLWRFKGSLEAAGDRINHIHPLSFLITIFTDEELKVAVRNLRKRGWVWTDFYSGLSQSLSEEFSRNNLSDVQVHSFAAEVGVSAADLLPAIHAARWQNLIDILIAKIPRKGPTDRYDM